MEELTRQQKIDIIKEKIGRKDYICPMTHVYRTVLNEITLQIVLKWKDENGGIWESIDSPIVTGKQIGRAHV